jgi:cyclic-di-GMP-binding protein
MQHSVRAPPPIDNPSPRRIGCGCREAAAPHPGTGCCAEKSIAMPYFDAVSKVDTHELSNAVDQANREVAKRYDLRGTGARFELQEFVISQFAQSEYQLNQLLDILRLRLAARGIDPRSLDLGEVEVNLSEARRKLTIKQGIEQAIAKKLVASLKQAKLKVDAQINGDKLRVSGKKRDDLQSAIALLRKCDIDLPLQFENFRD